MEIYLNLKLMKKIIRRWSGRQIISLILPNINVNDENNSYDSGKEGGDKLNYVKIRDGIINQGRFDKKIINSGTNGLIHIIFNDFGEKICQNF